MDMQLVERALQNTAGDRVEAATRIALSLMRDDPEFFQNGYTITDALLATFDAFQYAGVDVVDLTEREKVRITLRVKELS